MTKEKAQQLIDSIMELKGLKTKLMGWSNMDGYTLDGQMEAYLEGILDAEVKP